MKITFLTTVTYEDRTFSEGETCDLNDASAQHWIRRGMAEPARAVDPETATAEPAAEQAVTRKKSTRRKSRKKAQP